MSVTLESFFVGGRFVEAADGRRMVGQAYVQKRSPAEVTQPYPVVMIHGAGQTAMNFETTPDGRPGWADYFTARGYVVYLVDQPGRARSGYVDEFYGAQQPPTPVGRIEQVFSAPGVYRLWPTAHLHTQFPGTGQEGDESFAQFYASQVPGITDSQIREPMMRAAGAALLDRIGPAILLTHSQSGPLGWVITDERPDLVKAVVAVEPSGPPFMGVNLIGEPEWFAERALELPFGLTATPIAFDPPLPVDATGLERVPGPPTGDPHIVDGYRQPEPARKITSLDGVPVLLVTAEASYHAPFAHCTEAYLRQAGVAVEHADLAERGIHGNAHMIMLERNSDEVAELIAEWIEAQAV